MNITRSPYLGAPNILAYPDRKVREVKLDFSAADSYKAGTPVNAHGQLANDATCIGILLQDYHKSVGTGSGQVVISGHIQQDVAAEWSGVTISAEAKAALIDITFTGDGGRMASPLKKYTAEKTDGGYLVYGEMGRRPLLERFETLTTKGNATLATNFLTFAERLTDEECAMMVGRKVEVAGNVFTVTDAENTYFSIDGRYQQTAGDIIYSALEPIPVPASELTAALASGTVQLECDGETINIGTWTAVEDGKITGGAGGVTSWNDLPDKPFEDRSFSIVHEGSGHIDGAASVEFYGKVSDLILTKEDLIGATVTKQSGDQTVFTEEEYNFWNEEINTPVSGIIYGDGFIVVTKEGATIPDFADQPFSETGVYFARITTGFTTKLEKKDITPIDEKYLPESVKGGRFVVRFTGPSAESVTGCESTIDEIRTAWESGKILVAAMGYSDGIETTEYCFELTDVSLIDIPEENIHAGSFFFQRFYVIDGNLFCDEVGCFTDEETGELNSTGQHIQLTYNSGSV